MLQDKIRWGSTKQVHSTILVGVAHSHQIDDDDRTILEIPSWWMAADRNRIDPKTHSIGDSCSIIAISQLGQRLHLRPNDHPDRCDNDCPFEGAQTQYFVAPDSWKFLSDRGRILTSLMKAAKSTENGGACKVKSLNTWGADVWVSARAGSIDRNGRNIHESRSALLGLRNGSGIPIEEMMKEIREYIQKPYQTPKRNKARVESALSTA